jgi:hypothetical protein
MQSCMSREQQAQSQCCGGPFDGIFTCETGTAGCGGVCP